MSEGVIKREQSTVTKWWSKENPSMTNGVSVFLEPSSGLKSGRAQGCALACREREVNKGTIPPTRGDQVHHLGGGHTKRKKNHKGKKKNQIFRRLIMESGVQE